MYRTNLRDTTSRFCFLAQLISEPSRSTLRVSSRFLTAVSTSQTSPLPLQRFITVVESSFHRSAFWRITYDFSKLISRASTDTCQMFCRYAAVQTLSSGPTISRGSRKRILPFRRLSMFTKFLHVEDCSLSSGTENGEKKVGLLRLEEALDVSSAFESFSKRISSFRKVPIVPSLTASPLYIQ